MPAGNALPVDGQDRCCEIRQCLLPDVLRQLVEEVVVILSRRGEDHPQQFHLGFGDVDCSDEGGKRQHPCQHDHPVVGEMTTSAREQIVRYASADTQEKPMKRVSASYLQPFHTDPDGYRQSRFSRPDEFLRSADDGFP